MAVYLIHFAEPLSHARHYVGYTANLARRIKEHTQGRNSPLMRAVNEAGIPWHVARIWPDGDRDLERKIKASHKSARYCPHCKPRLAVPVLPKKLLGLMSWHVPDTATIILPMEEAGSLSPCEGIPVLFESIPCVGDGFQISFPREFEYSQRKESYDG